MIMKDKSILKIQIIFMGHLRGTSHLNDLKKFFDLINLDRINNKLNTNYKNLQVDFYLFTYPEINFKAKILAYGKVNFPELYKIYTIEDFNQWLDSYNKIFNFKKIVLNDVEKLKTDTDIRFNYLNDNCQEEFVKCALPHIKMWAGSILNKCEKINDIIDDDYDIVFKTRPDIIFNYDFNNDLIFDKINDIICSLLIDNSNSVYINWYYMNHGYLWAGDYYHIGKPKNLKLFFSNIFKNNTDLILEFDKLNKKDFPTISKYLARYVESANIEIRQTLNCMMESINLKPLHLNETLLYIYVPYDKNFSREINYHTIHDEWNPTFYDNYDWMKNE